MALKFAVTSSYLNISPVTALDQNLAGGYVAIVKLTAAATTRQMYVKGTASSTAKRFTITGAEALQASVGSTGTILQTAATLSNFAGFAVNKWVVIAARYSTSLTNTDQLLYLGELGGALKVPSAYSTQTVGTATYSTDAGTTAHIGDSNVSTSGFTDSMAAIAVFVGYPSFEDLQATANELRVRGRKLRLPSTVKCAYQLVNLGTLPDLTGNGLTAYAGGGVTTPVTDVPWRWEGRLANAFYSAQRVAVVAAGTGLFPDRRRRYLALSGEV